MLVKIGSIYWVDKKVNEQENRNVIEIIGCMLFMNRHSMGRGVSLSGLIDRIEDSLRKESLCAEE